MPHRSDSPASHAPCWPAVVFISVLTPQSGTTKDQQRESEQAGLERLRANLPAVSLDGRRRQSPLLITKPFESIITILFESFILVLRRVAQVTPDADCILCSALLLDVDKAFSLLPIAGTCEQMGARRVTPPALAGPPDTASGREINKLYIRKYMAFSVAVGIWHSGLQGIANTCAIFAPRFPGARGGERKKGRKTLLQGRE